MFFFVADLFEDWNLLLHIDSELPYYTIMRKTLCFLEPIYYTGNDTPLKLLHAKS